jgi:hypothetical protein
MITDPPYGIELDSEWRDRAGLNGHDQFGIAASATRYLVILSDRESGPAENAYTNILEEVGFLPPTRVATVDFTLIPRGLNAKETERFVWENGARIYGSRASRNVAAKPNGRSRLPW